MANSINWGKVYCLMTTDEVWGESAFTTHAILDSSAPSCWAEFPLTADLTSILGLPFLADTTKYRASATQK